MAWERPESWWSQGMTAPFGMVASHDEMFAVWEHSSRDRGLWEVRVAADGTAYTYYAGDDFEVLSLRECPRRKPTGPDGGR